MPAPGGDRTNPSRRRGFSRAACMRPLIRAVLRSQTRLSRDQRHPDRGLPLTCRFTGARYPQSRWSLLPVLDFTRAANVRGQGGLHQDAVGTPRGSARGLRLKVNSGQEVLAQN